MNDQPTLASVPAQDHRRSDRTSQLALVLQGGGALGAYQAGVYETLHMAKLEPTWVAGVSIGGINSAIIAGNPPEHRLERLREFWNLITDRRIWLLTPDGDGARKAHNTWSSMLTAMQGQPGFFDVNIPGPWLSPRGGKQATSYYDNAPLRETLLRLVDFDLINTRRMRFAVGATNVRTGNFNYFDNAKGTILPEHVMATGALPPALPMSPVGTEFFWDGGLVSNTPLQHLLEHIGADDISVFQVDLFSARGALPRDMYDVLARAKDIQYSSRTRLVTDYYTRLHKMRLQMRALFDLIPEADLSAEQRALKASVRNLPAINIMHLIYQQAAYEGQAKDYEFSAASMREHWAAGMRDTERTLRHKDWLEGPATDSGISVHDIHRADQG